MYSRLRKALIERDDWIKQERETANRWRRERGFPEYPHPLKDAYANYLTPMVLLTINTGMRRGESFSLKWENVNFHTCTLTVEGGLSKSGSTRHIPLNEEAVEVLKAWRDQSSVSVLVFPGKAGGQLVSISKVWASVMNSAGIKDFRFHDLRHTFASNLVMKGVPLNTVRELLGHQDMSTSLRYAHLAPDHKAEAVAKLIGTAL